MRGGDLIGGGREADLGARTRAVVGMHAGEPCPGGAVVIATAVAFAVGFTMREVREDVEVIAHAFKRLQVGRQLVLTAGLTRLPLRMNDAMCRVDEPEPHRCLPRRRPLRRQSGHHGIQQRQCDARTHPLQHGPPGQHFSGEERHVSPLVFYRGALKERRQGVPVDAAPFGSGTGRCSPRPAPARRRCSSGALIPGRSRESSAGRNTGLYVTAHTSTVCRSSPRRRAPDRAARVAAPPRRHRRPSRPAECS